MKQASPFSAVRGCNALFRNDFGEDLLFLLRIEMSLLHYSKPELHSSSNYLNKWSCSLRYNSDALDTLYELQRHNIIPSTSLLHMVNRECNWQQQQNDYLIGNTYNWHTRYPFLGKLKKNWGSVRVIGWCNTVSWATRMAFALQQMQLFSNFRTEIEM